MKRPLRILFSLVVISALCGFALIILFGGRRASPPAMPNPNGLDDLVKAGEMVSESLDDYKTASTGELHAYVAKHAAALERLRVGLGRECRVPLDIGVSNSLLVLASIKKLALLLSAEGRLAELENRPANAVHSYLDAVHLGSEVSRGGPIINRLVGNACAALGLAPLAKLAPTLACEQIRPTVAELEKLSSADVTWDEVRQNERAYVRQLLHQSHNPIMRLPMQVASLWASRDAIRNAEQKHNRVAARIRLLTVELALRCYRSEEGPVPVDLKNLIPKHLKLLPADPFSGQPLVYRAQGTNWLLYSVGPDGVDDGGVSVGRPVPGSVPKGDLLFDSPW